MFLATHTTFSQAALLFFLSGLLFQVACTPDEPMEPTELTVPDSYLFTNVSYDGQLQRLSQLAELKAYMADSQTPGVALDADRLAAMYANDAAVAGWQGSYDSSKQLRDKTLSSVQADFDALLAALAAVSTSETPGSAGVAGVVESLDGNKQYLLGANGVEYAQVIEKGLMGACFYYQATSVYLGSDRMDVDNTLVTEGEGTKMEHHWDEAFGYFGVPPTFPSNLDGLLFWGNYSNQRNALLNCNSQLMDALLLGRAAISANALDRRDEAIQTVREQWELIAVGSALHYLNLGMAQFDDMALRAHVLSEGIGFIYALQFNTGKKISNDEIEALLETVAGSADFDSMDLYTTTPERLEAARDLLAEYYGLENQKDAF